jgi:uncharacterized protein (PEP-CTERM system associated)
MIGGVEATGAISNYPNQPQSNFGTFTIGSFFEMQLTRYTHMNVSGGYNRFTARGTGLNPERVESVVNSNDLLATAVTDSATNLQPVRGNPSGYYASLSLLHRLNRYYSDSLSVGHSESVDPFSGLAKTDYIRYSGNWRVNERLSLVTGIFYENVEQVGRGSINGTFIASYERFGLSLGTGFQLTEHTGLSLGYQFTKRESVEESQSFTQNQLTISIGYRF